MNNTFAVFILSYKRAKKVVTYKTLREQGYTGPIYVVIGNDDPTAKEYIDEYGDEVIIFDKYKYMETVDTIDNRGKIGCVVYARIGIFDVAKEYGYDKFVVLDDDYGYFISRRMVGKKLEGGAKRKIHNLDKAFDATFDFLMETDSDVVCWAQSGDFIGGPGSNVWKKQLTRKAMNTWFCRTDRPLDFKGSTNEDVNYYVCANMRGEKCFTVANANVNQCDTQQNSGGLTEIYLNDGTYIKSFYSVICQPSCVKISRMGVTHFRYHHNVDWVHCSPEIINEKYRKASRKG